MQVSIIASVSKNNYISKNGVLAINSVAYMEFFKRMTIGNIVIMGRKTCESIEENYLSNRENFVVTHNVNNVPDHPELMPVNSLEEALFYSRQIEGSGPTDLDIFIIGGAEIYKQALESDVVDTMYLAVYEREVYGELSFPYYDDSKYNIVDIENHDKDGFKIYTLKRNEKE